MGTTNFALDAYQKFAALPLGRQLFSKALCLKAPYFGTVKPLVAELRPRYCEVHAKKRRGVHNHLGTFHAIACCNMAELAAGMLTEVSIPTTHRWIPRGMTVEYLAKATTDLRAVAEVTMLPEFTEEGTDLQVPVNVLDTHDTVVVRAVITMRVSPKKSAASHSASRS
jgi:acyl-coenzyme A thioesterase PaaI-like protein